MLDNGLKSITASYELSANSITELAKVMGPSRASQLEVVAHAHLPIFHTEHCVFARFLSKGNSYLDCGHVCTKNTVHLRDPNGSDNLVLADMGCRNTVFSAEAQSGVHSLKDWREAGVGRIRLELVDENEENVKKIVKGYLAVLNNNEKPSECFEMLKSVCDSNGRTGGVGYGSLRNTSERRAGEL
jgi:collagenase-like PrtC family protease